MGSLVLAALCGSTYGWHHRSVNPPFVITRRTEEEPPEAKLLRKGRYDEAARATLDSIKDEKQDYFKYYSVAAVFGARAVKDPSSREKWLEQAAFYVNKGVSLASDDSMNLMDAVHSLWIASEIFPTKVAHTIERRANTLKTQCVS